MLRLTLRTGLVTFSLAWRLVAPSQQNPGSAGSETGQLTSMEMQGNVGPYPVGLNYTVRNNTELIAAHYFYTSQLKNISLTVAVRGETVDFQGADGSTFHLHFVGNGSNGTQPLTFYNSIGLKGTWTAGRRSFPVNLKMMHGTANPGESMYAEVTDQSDLAYEEMVILARKAILGGNVIEAAKHVHFPLRVTGTHRSLTIRNQAELKAQWSSVFTSEFLAKLQKDVPHEMFVHNGEAMLGDGELWFDDKGLVAVNPLIGRADLIKRQ